MAEQHPQQRHSLPTAELIAMAKRAPTVDPNRLRRDIDAIFDDVAVPPPGATDLP